MSERASESGRVVHVDTLARVEGEGAMHVRVRGGQVSDVRLKIYEPPRFFEGLLRGRGHTEPPDITARICGICPVAYQMSSSWAIEDACGAEVTEAIRLMRRLLYCAEWIESHALHIFFLHAPDFLGYDGAIEMAADHRDLVERGLRIRKAGNALMSVIGGRPVHPVNVRVGGFYRMPTRAELSALRPSLEQALHEAVATVSIVGDFDVPEMVQPYEYLALRAPAGYPIEWGSVVTSSGGAWPVRDLGRHLAEVHVEHSTALHAVLDGAPEPYVVGPLARYSLNADRLSTEASAAARAAGLGPECRNPFRSIVVRAVEVVEAVVEALRIIDGWTDGAAPSVEVPPRAGEGFGASEAPRGVLFHRYVIDDAGTIRDAQIIPPTSQNQRSVEADLRTLVETWGDLEDDVLRHRCEQAIRNYDPCISCATHFLDLTVDRR